MKTANVREVEVLTNMLDPMITHLEEPSMLARIYGLYMVVTSRFVPVYLILMQNTCVLVDFVSSRYGEQSSTNISTDVTHLLHIIYGVKD